MIENRVNAPQKRAAEGREAVRKKLVQRSALVHSSNLDTPLIFIVHTILL